MVRQTKRKKKETDCKTQKKGGICDDRLILPSRSIDRAVVLNRLQADAAVYRAHDSYTCIYRQSRKNKRDKNILQDIRVYTLAMAEKNRREEDIFR